VGSDAERHRYNRISITVAPVRFALSRRGAARRNNNLDPQMMSRHPLCTTLLLAALWLVSAATRADTAQELEKLHKSGQTDQALRQADALIAAQPRDAAVRFQKGVMLADLQRRDEAIVVYVSLTEDFPELPDPYNNLAVLYAATGQLESALNALRSALRNDPKHGAALENLGDVHLALAMQAWSTAEVSSKDDTTALQRKLRLAREMMRLSSPQAAPRAPG
jgi:Flp pilus assembly protein TadD